MSGRLQLIEQKLIGIGPAEFQNLCDVYLSLRERNISSIGRTGSQLGKQKTVKGTPDTFFRLADGSFRCVEYTTQAENLIDKLKSSIDNCLDPGKTGIASDEVSKVILFFNSRLDISEESEIFGYAQSKKVHIELIGLDWLALEIYSKYLILAKDFLGIPLDTGQLLPLDRFIDEYDNKAGKLSTPLDNSFLHRSKELTEIKNVLQTSDLLIISGFPGVGKTKIALESINKFLESNTDFSAFVVSNKNQDISEDLRIHLQEDSDFILLVDDANRQLVNFRQILGVFKEIRKGKIKLLITVRDYAYNEVRNECFEFDPHCLIIDKFSDEEIKGLISSDSFEINNSIYQNKIIEIADGNARLAIMAARLAKQRQQSFLVNDVSELFDSYFQTFIKDFDIFSNKVLVNTLGIISFFFSIDRNNKEFIQSVLETFEMDYYAFNEALIDLEKRELIDSNYNVVKVSEQVMASYFFYRVFIKDEFLSFTSLLHTYYNARWLPRFKESIISSNNLFFYTKPEIISRINFWLGEYYECIKDDQEKILEFFTLFWIYKREDLLAYFYDRIIQIPEPENPVYNTKYETNDFVWPQDKTLNFLVNLFDHYSGSFVNAIELSFEYCRKKPDSLPELIRRIREKLLFDEIDERYGFIRQEELFNHVIRKVKEKEIHYVEAFFALSGTFLHHYFQIHKGGRKHTVSFYEYPLPFYEVTRDFRTNVWSTLFNLFDTYPKKSFDVIKSIRPGFRESIIAILEFDLSLLITFIKNKLDKKDFSHINFVHELIFWLDSENLKDRSYRELKAEFYSKEFEFFRKMDWDYLREKQEFEYNNHQEFDILKEKEIRSFFIFSDQSEFDVLNHVLSLALSLEVNNEWSLVSSIDIIIEENFSRNNELGFKLLDSILNSFPRGLQVLNRTLTIIVNQSDSWAGILLALIKDCKNDNKLWWHLSFFSHLPESFVNDFFLSELYIAIDSIDKFCIIYFQSLEKFLSLDNNLFNKILLKIIDKIEIHKIPISFSSHFFENYSDYFAADYVLLEKAYLQQVTFDPHFDYDTKGLKKLVSIRLLFLLDYITLLCTDKNTNNRISEKHIPFIWDIKDQDQIIEKAIDLIIESNPYLGIGRYELSIIFDRLSDNQKPIAKKFILYYLSKNKENPTKIGATFGIIHKSFHDFFEEAFIYYLSANPEVETFKRIQWIGNGIYHGEVIIGEIRAKRWDELFWMAEKCNNQLDLILIKNYIKQQIESEMKYADWEKKRKFSDPSIS